MTSSEPNNWSASEGSVPVCVPVCVRVCERSCARVHSKAGQSGHISKRSFWTLYTRRTTVCCRENDGDPIDVEDVFCKWKLEAALSTPYVDTADASAAEAYDAGDAEVSDAVRHALSRCHCGGFIDFSTPPDLLLHRLVCYDRALPVFCGQNPTFTPEEPT